MTNLNSSDFVKDYQAYLNKSYNPIRARKEKAYLYSDLKHFGLGTQRISDYNKTVDSQLIHLNKTKMLQLVKAFWNLSSFEEKSMALHILNIHKNKIDVTDINMIEKMMIECKGWALLDNLIIPIMPEILSKDNSVYEYLKKWIKDDDFWVRRSAILAQLLFLRKGKGGNRRLFFEMCTSQFSEDWIDEIYSDLNTKRRARFFIRKAIGWSLRELSKNHPEEVVEFVNKYKDQMSGLTYKEATRKLPIEYKEGLY